MNLQLLTLVSCNKSVAFCANKRLIPLFLIYVNHLGYSLSKVFKCPAVDLPTHFLNQNLMYGPTFVSKLKFGQHIFCYRWSLKHHLFWTWISVSVPKLRKAYVWQLVDLAMVLSGKSRVNFTSTIIFFHWHFNCVPR